MEITKLNEKIWQYKNIHSNIDDILNKASKEFWAPYTNSAGEGEGSTNRGNTLIGYSSMIFPENPLYNEVLNIFFKCFSNYIFENNLNIPLENLDINPVEKRDWLEQKYVLIRKYLKGSELGPHEDGGHPFAPKYTGLVYFNENYVGGEIGFPKENIKIKPLSASMLIFPSNTVHQVHPLIDGERYVASAYLYESPNNA